MTELDRVSLKAEAERTLMFGLPGETVRVDPRQILVLLSRLYELEHPKPVCLDPVRTQPRLLAKNTVESFDFECVDCGYMFADPPFIKDGQTLCYSCAGEDVP